MPFKQLEKETREFIEGVVAQGGPPLYKLPIKEARAVLDDLQAVPVPLATADIEEKVLHCGPDKKVHVKIIRPSGSRDKLPVIMFFHGGGWILGNFGTHERLMREIAVGVKAAVVYVGYTPSPEAKYPKAIEEAYAATQYVADHGDALNLDTSRFAIAGDSVGGNMTAVVALLAKERKGPKIAFQVLLYPVTDADFNTPSYIEFAQGPWLTKLAMEWFWEAYAPHKTDRKKHHVAPLHATLEELKDLPPALVITDENDVLRDEGEAYAHKLIRAGVKVTAVRYIGTHHDFMMLNPLRNTPATRSAIDLTVQLLRKALKVAS